MQIIYYCGSRKNPHFETFFMAILDKNCNSLCRNHLRQQSFKSLQLISAGNKFHGAPPKMPVSTKVSSCLKHSSFKIDIFSASLPSHSSIYSNPFTSKPCFWPFKPRFYNDITIQIMKNLC